VRANPRLGLPELKMADGPFGIRKSGPSTTYAAGIALAASWDVDLAERVGTMLGRDARARRVHFLLAPAVNIYGHHYAAATSSTSAKTLARVAHGGCVHQGRAIPGRERHHQALPGNNSEFDRHHTSSEIDERTMREIYLPTFEAACARRRWGPLCFYNLVNGVHMTENQRLIQQLVKQEWGFEGIVMSTGTPPTTAWPRPTRPGPGDASGKFMNRATLIPAIKQARSRMPPSTTRSAHPAYCDPVRLAGPRAD